MMCGFERPELAAPPVSLVEHYRPLAWAKKFHTDEATLRLVYGPRASGRSTAGYAEALYQSWNFKDNMGVIFTPHSVRNTIRFIRQLMPRSMMHNRPHLDNTRWQPTDEIPVINKFGGLSYIVVSPILLLSQSNTVFTFGSYGWLMFDDIDDSFQFNQRQLEHILSRLRRQPASLQVWYFTDDWRWHRLDGGPTAQWFGDYADDRNYSLHKLRIIDGPVHYDDLYIWDQARIAEMSDKLNAVLMD